MESVFGPNNAIVEYGILLLVYACMFLFIRFSKPVIELNFRSRFVYLGIVWAILMFSGNYLFYLLGVMSFLPWLNNFLHSLLWVGICLGWLYYTCKHRPLPEQFLHFAFASFIIKMAEHLLLGSWSMDSYLGIHNPYAYLIAMSIVDGFYPIVSIWLLKIYKG